MIKIDLGFCEIEQKAMDTIYILLKPDLDLNADDLKKLYNYLTGLPNRSSSYLVLFTAPGSFLMGQDRVSAVPMFNSVGYAGIAVVMENLARKISTTYFRSELSANDSVAWFDSEDEALEWVKGRKKK